MAAFAARTAPIANLGLDKLGIVVAALLAIGAASPFMVFRANRIVANLPNDRDYASMSPRIMERIVLADTGRVR